MDGDASLKNPNLGTIWTTKWLLDHHWHPWHHHSLGIKLLELPVMVLHTWSICIMNHVGTLSTTTRYMQSQRRHCASRWGIPVLCHRWYHTITSLGYRYLLYFVFFLRGGNTCPFTARASSIHSGNLTVCYGKPSWTDKSLLSFLFHSFVGLLEV
jgi:hypothetical protein